MRLLKLLCCPILLLVIFTSVSFGEQRPYKKHELYFQGTDYELNVFKIYGRKDGKTMLIVGGIQGDEPGGFLSADLYSDISLDTGNLIVIPRANFKSVILFNRGPDGDMNRRFQQNNEVKDMDKVVEVIKKLMSESDVFLNLHDGWGYHSSKYVDELRNPKRFGQSVIVDADMFQCKDGKIIDLKTPSLKALIDANEKIPDEKHHLSYFNTNTESPSTNFKDMRKTATYFALKNYCLPSYGIESSKNLPSVDIKVLHHNYLVNAFMKYYGIIPETPQILLPKPILNYAVLSVNGQPTIVENNKDIFLQEGDSVEITHIDSNYDRGLSCDILGVNGLNDFKVPFKVGSSGVKVIFRKDNEKIGNVNIKIKKMKGGNYWTFIMKVNGSEKAVLSGDTVRVRKNDTIELIKAFHDGINDINPPINFKGYVSNSVTSNDGDDRGYKIVLSDRNLIHKFSKNGSKKIYTVIAGDSANVLGSFEVEILD